MNNKLHNLIQTGGWKEAKRIFNEAIKDAKDTSTINEHLDDATYAREGRARTIAAKAMENVVKNIELSAGGEPTKKISYK